MSGPKSSRFTLTAEQRRLIREEAERRRAAAEEARRRAQEQEKRCRLLESIAEESGGVSGQLAALESLERADGYDLPWLPEAAGKLEEIRRKSREIAAAEPGDSREYAAANERLSALLKQLAALRSACADERGRISDETSEELDEILSGGVHLSFAGLGRAGRKKGSEEIRKINDELAGLAGTQLPASMLEHLAGLRKTAESITDEGYLKTFRAAVVEPFVRQCREYDGVRREHDALLARYAVLAAECGTEPKPVPYTRQGIEFLKEEIARLEALALEQKEEEYIHAALEETMREMGYTLAGGRTVAKRSGKRIRHELYALDNGTAVDVTYAEDGQIVMELGGLDDTDRTPEAAEVTQLVEDMESFCSDYDELARRLAEKGVRTRKVVVNPPAPEFAQIINSNDYSLKRPVAKYSAGRKKKAGPAGRRETE